jgi:hypothetical protein
VDLLPGESGGVFGGFEAVVLGVARSQGGAKCGARRRFA